MTLTRTMIQMFRNHPKLTLISIASAMVLFGESCTLPVNGQFKLAQQNETFGGNIKINTQLDLLWVVDNSASMDINQQHLRDGFATFANTYLQPTWDIHIAVITTDAYLANPAFAGYLSSVVPGTQGYSSAHISGINPNFTNPAAPAAPALANGQPMIANLAAGTFRAQGIAFNEMIPGWGANWAKLIAGLHDGPTTALCFEGLPYFLLTESQCSIRDNRSVAKTGTSDCLNPTGAETSITQCVNTIQNDTVHSGNPIISTLLPSTGGWTNSTWQAKITNDFKINASTGSVGSGSERGLGSVLQFLNDNESSVSAFFRPGSMRGIIVISDEDDQTQTLPAAPAQVASVWTNYACDQAGIEAANGTSAAGGTNSYCCAPGTFKGGGNCSFGSGGTSCSSKTVNGLTYTLGLCPLNANLSPVSSIKSQYDAFFNKLDGGSGTNPNYFFDSIVAINASTISSLQTLRGNDDALASATKITATDRGDRYIAMSTAVAADTANFAGNGSSSMDILSDYSQILNQIGLTIVQKKGVFTLNRAPLAAEQILVTVVHADGTSNAIIPTKYTVSGKQLMITDTSTVLNFKSTDQLSISYAPATAF